MEGKGEEGNRRGRAIDECFAELFPRPLWDIHDGPKLIPNATSKLLSKYNQK